MVTFLIAFSLECFSTTSKVATFATAAVWIAVALLVCWTIITGWESTESAVPVRIMLRDLWERFYPFHKELDEGEESGPAETGSTATAHTSPKAEAERRWWKRVHAPHWFPHSSDPPMDMRGTPSSVV